MSGMRMVWLGLVTTGLVFLVGCDELPPPQRNVTGTWIGRLDPFSISGIPEPFNYLVGAWDGTLEFPAGLPFTMMLKQDMSGFVSGTAKVSAVIAQEFSVAGNVSETRMNLEGKKQFVSDSPVFDIFIYSGNIESNTMTGEWSVYQGTNQEKEGTFIVHRR